MLSQGFNTSHGRHGYKDREDLILESSGQVVYMTEVDSHKLKAAIKFTTSSGMMIGSWKINVVT